MLVTIATDSDCFSPESIISSSRRDTLGSILAAATKNAVIVCDSKKTLINESLQHIKTLKPEYQHKLEMLLTELIKQDPFIELGYPRPGDKWSRLRSVAESFEIDSIICSDTEAFESLAGSSSESISRYEVSDLDSYYKTETESNREQWLQTQRLDSVARAEAEALLARSIRLYREVSVIDRMVGKWANDVRGPNKKLRNWAKGVVNLLTIWTEYSFHARSGKLKCSIVTEAGDTGARGGFLDPDRIQEKTREALRQADRGNVLRKVDLAIDTRKDSHPSKLQDRWLTSGPRSWQISHGSDALYQITLPKEERSAIQLHADCPSSRSIVADILKLRKL